MDNKEDNFNDVITRLESRALKLEPSRQGWQTLVDRLAVTEERENRLNKQKVNIISPFYYYMSNTGKVLSALALVAVFAIGGVVYYQMTLSGNDGAIVATLEDGSSQTEAPIFEDSVNGDIDSLLASFEEEQLTETSALAMGDVDVATLAEESTLVGEINQTYQDEL